MLPVYHYTCGHHAPTIERTGVLLAAQVLAASSKHATDYLRRHPELRTTTQVVWLTTDPALCFYNRARAGLTSDNLLDCDRTEYRFRVTHGFIQPWTDVREVWPRRVVEFLEHVEGVHPETWWVGRGPLRAVRSDHHRLPQQGESA